MKQLHSAEQAVREALAAGLKHLVLSASYRELQSYLLEPAFWQALGKAREWKDLTCNKCGNEDCGLGAFCGNRHRQLVSSPVSHALRYFETRLSNGDEKAFWQSLP